MPLLFAAGQRTLPIWELPGTHRGWGPVLCPQAELQIQKWQSPGIPAVCHQGQSMKNKKVSICGTGAVIFCHKLQVFMQRICRKWNAKAKIKFYFKTLCEHLTNSIIHKQGFPGVIPHRDNSKESGRCSLRVSWYLGSNFCSWCSHSICTFIDHCSTMQSTAAWAKFGLL